MDNFVTPELQSAVVLLLTTILTALAGFVANAVKKWSSKLDEDTIVAKALKNEKLRQVVKEAAWTGLKEAVLKGYGGTSAIEEAIKYVERSSNESRKELGMGRDVLADVLRAMLPDVKAQIADAHKRSEQ